MENRVLSISAVPSKNGTRSVLGHAIICATSITVTTAVQTVATAVRRLTAMIVRRAIEEPVRQIAINSGLEGAVIVTQDLFIYEITGEDENGKIIGRHRSTGIARPRFWDRARYYGLERELAEALDAAE